LCKIPSTRPNSVSEVENSQKSVCGRVSAPDPAGGAHDAMGARGKPPPQTPPLGAFGASLIGAFGTSNLAAPPNSSYSPQTYGVWIIHCTARMLHAGG